MSVFLESLKKSGHLDRISMTICNVGSRKITSQDDYGSQGWEIFAPNLTIYGFDADADACDAANADIEQRQVSWTEKHIPLALGKSVDEATLYVTQNPMCCSLYPPNESYIARFTGLSDVMNLDFTVEIETTTLDRVCQDEEIQEIDFLQIDIQGAELSVLAGAEQLLNRSVLAIQVEVNFSQIYVNQPLFAELDKYLRGQGFTLFDLAVARRLRKDSPVQSIDRPGQLLWGDALYFRDLIREDLDSPLQNAHNIFKLAGIADVMKFPDYALELLAHLTLHYAKDNPHYNLAKNIIEGIGQFPELLQKDIALLPIVHKIRNYLSEEDFSSFKKTTTSPKNPSTNPFEQFHTYNYLRNNQRRLEHLSSLGLEISGDTVLELGAGIGDHTTFFLDKECQVVTTEARPENLKILRDRYPHLDVRHLDLDHPDFNLNEVFDIVYCYGLLYHLEHPAEAIAFMADCCRKMLLLETCVSIREDASIYSGTETATHPSQSIWGKGCRPSRKWIYNHLKQYFEFVYLPITQPNHEHFPIDWTDPDLSQHTFTRSVFIAAKFQLDNPLLLDYIPMKQRRH